MEIRLFPDRQESLVEAEPKPLESYSQVSPIVFQPAGVALLEEEEVLSLSFTADAVTPLPVVHPIALASTGAGMIIPDEQLEINVDQKLDPIGMVGLHQRF